jgi:hypothetical protein
VKPMHAEMDRSCSGHMIDEGVSEDSSSDPFSRPLPGIFSSQARLYPRRQASYILQPTAIPVQRTTGLEIHFFEFRTPAL